jgi:Na+-driven multidrug efflux pump
VAPVFSFHYGKQDRLRLRKLFSMCIRFVSAASVLVFAAALVLGAPLVELFSPKGTRVYEIGSQGFQIFSWSFLLCGLNIFTSAVFTALSDGKRSAVLSFLRTFGLILVLLLFLPEFLGVTGVWLAVPVAELVTGVVAVGLWRGIWK